VKGVHSLGCVGCEEERLWIGTIVGDKPRFWVAECEEWTTKRAKPPYQIIAST